MALTELALGLPGQVFRCPMPFSAYDPQGRSLSEFRTRHVSAIVLLAEHQECIQRAGRDLPHLYEEEGFELIHVPVRDFDVPAPDALGPAVERALAEARAGRNVAIHCHAGKGRTGLFAACLAKAALGFSGDEAIAWIRRHIPGAVETAAQEEFVRSYDGPGNA